MTTHNIIINFTNTQNKMKTKLLFALLALTMIVKAQSTFQKTFGGTADEEFNSLQQTTDGGFIIGGYTKSFGNGTEDVFLTKTDANGNISWSRTYYGINEEGSSAVQQTPDGGYITTGYTTSFGVSNSDIYIVKTDAGGTIQWSKTFGGSSGEESYSITNTADGGYAIIGSTTSYGSGGADIYFLKIDSNGNLVWNKTYGGIYWDIALSMQQTSDNGFAITGMLGLDTATSTGADICLLKTDSNGNLQWSKTFGGIDYEVGNSVIQTLDGGFIITGYTWSFAGAGSAETYLIKTDANGVIQWSKIYGGTNLDYGSSVRTTSDGGYIISGYTTSYNIFGNEDAYLIKTDNSGNVQWTKIFGGIGGNTSDWGIAQQTPDGGFIVSGSTKSFGAGMRDGYLIKTDSNGNSNCNDSLVTSVSNNVTFTTGTPAINTNSGGTLGNPSSLSSTNSVTVSVLCSTVGIFENISSEKFISVYPNPSTDIIYLIGIATETVTLFNSFGQIIITTKGTNSLDISAIPSGLYFVQLTDNSGQIIKTTKIIKE